MPAIGDRVRPGDRAPCRARVRDSGLAAVHQGAFLGDLVGRHRHLLWGAARRGVDPCPDRLSGRVARVCPFPNLWRAAEGRRAAVPGLENPLGVAAACACPCPNRASCVASRGAGCARASILVRASGARGSRSASRAAPFGKRAGEQPDRNPSRGRSSESDTNALATDATTSRR
jgi:hypothetical protein